MKVCLTCKHWGAGLQLVRYAEYPMACNVLREKLDIEIDQGSGWNAFVARIETPPEFGCCYHEEMP